MTVSPYYAQVALLSAHDPDQWPTDWSEGDQYSSTPGGVAVATISDLDGTVLVALYVGEVNATGHRFLASTALQTTDGRMLLGNPLATGNSVEVDLSPGTCEVVIYTDAAPARSVIFAIR
jgi:hypothetical protein